VPREEEQRDWRQGLRQRKKEKKEFNTEITESAEGPEKRSREIGDRG
jgi:hypothetical protein